jgi:hypothetical protein
MQRQQLSRHQLEFDAKISAVIIGQAELGPTSEQLDNESSHNEQSPFGKISTRLMNEYQREVNLHARAVETEQSARRGKYVHSLRLHLVRIQGPVFTTKQNEKPRLAGELRKKLARKKQDMAAKMRAVTLAADKLILEADDIAVREQQLQIGYTLTERRLLSRVRLPDMAGGWESTGGSAPWDRCSAHSDQLGRACAPWVDTQPSAPLCAEGANAESQPQRQGARQPPANHDIRPE